MFRFLLICSIEKPVELGMDRSVNVLETVKDEYLKVAAQVKDNGSKIIS